MDHGLDDVELGVIVGDRQSLDELFSLTYEQLRRLASSVRRSDANATISPTALVNEAWLKLADAPPRGVVSRLHFRRIAARAMRQVLVEAARRRNAGKRGGGLAPVTFDEALEPGPAGAADGALPEGNALRRERRSASD